MGIDMKDAEDEAFDDLERRQGAGGFHAKQDMAMHKTQDQHICRHYKQWQHCHICDLEAQVAELTAKREWVGLTDEDIEDCVEMSIQKTCRAVEAKLKEKNNGT